MRERGYDVDYIGDGWLFECDTVKMVSQENKSEDGNIIRSSRVITKVQYSQTDKLCTVDNDFLEEVYAPVKDSILIPEEYDVEWCTDYLDYVFDVVAIMPEFPGGGIAMYKFLNAEVQYPALALDNSIQGKYYVNFVVEPCGTIAQVKTVRGSHKLLNKEAERVIGSMPNWIPGESNGKRVSVSYTIPVKFRLK